ncbi:MAG: peptidoglycan-binding protein [Solirubrobacteraceae bacterium]
MTMPLPVPHRTARPLAAFAAAAAACAALAGPASAATGGIIPVDPVPGATVPTPTTPTGGGDGTIAAPFRGNGMWIWQIPKANGGNVDAITAQARKAGVRTLFIKSADGTGRWQQFSPQMVQAFHARGLKVCGWHYVYGASPKAEAIASAWAKTAGADCFVIDAETEFEGRYAQASIYVRELRKRVGASFPVGLAPFPYVDFHPSFPYSVFLAPGAASYNLPQMYWRAIGTTVDQVYAHTYRESEIYKRPILPLGQTYMSAPPAQIKRFRTLGRAYGAAGLSWWDWQSTIRSGWSALAAPVTPPTFAAAEAYPRLRRGSKGDQVVWAQQLLAGAGKAPASAVTGLYGAVTVAAVKAFQAAEGLSPTGVLDDTTWPALIDQAPLPVAWDKKSAAKRRARAASGAAVTGPWSAGLPARAYELPPKRQR